MIGPLTYLDAALIAVALISGLLAMYRGLTREVLSIVSWAVAALAGQGDGKNSCVRPVIR